MSVNRTILAPTRGGSVKVVFQHLMGSLQNVHCLLYNLHSILTLLKLSLDHSDFL